MRNQLMATRNPSAKEREAMAAVLALVRERRRPVTPCDVAEALGVPKAAARGRLFRLVLLGRLEVNYGAFSPATRSDSGE